MSETANVMGGTRRLFDTARIGADWASLASEMRAHLPDPLLVEMLVARHALLCPDKTPAAVSEQIRLADETLALALEIQSEDRDRRIRAGIYWVKAIRNMVDRAARLDAPMTNIPLFLFEAIMAAARQPPDAFAAYLHAHDLFRVWMCYGRFSSQTRLTPSDYVLRVTDLAYKAIGGPDTEELVLVTDPFVTSKYGMTFAVK